MKNEDLNNYTNFIPYDDENIEHATSGPDYGQPWSSSNAWTELDSVEYPDFVKQVIEKISHRKIRIVI